MVTAAETNLIRQVGLSSSRIVTNTISILSMNRSKTSATAMRPWYGNAGMAALKFLMRCGSTSNLGKNEAYSDNQAEDLPRHKEVFPELDAWTTRFAQFVEAKGKVEPGKYRAFGYEPPGHLLRDVRLAWREIRMRFGNPRIRSSPAKQQRLDLNRDVTKTPKKSEGEKLRDGQ